MRKLSKLVSLMLSVVLCIGMAAPALAVEYDVADGVVYVKNDNDEKGVYSYQGERTEETKITYTKDDSEIIITGSYEDTDWNATGSRIDVGENVKDTTITLKDVNIGVSRTGYNPYGGSKTGEAALSITGQQSDVTIRLEGENTLASGEHRAGLELSDGASVTVDGTGTLTVIGGYSGAGIGSGKEGSAGNITISGSGTVTAMGGYYGAGIGSGGGYNSKSSVGDITISGSGSVTATSKSGGAAGIGSGYGMSYGDSEAGTITISCTANVTATGKEGGQDIGRGVNGKVGTVELNHHDYRLDVTKPASCTEDGSKKYTCKNCDDSYTEEGDPATGHNYTSEITREATCTEDGVMTYTCVKGDDSYTEAIPAKGHGEGVWRVTTPAQPGVPGVETLVCPDCGEPLGQTRPIPALPVPAIPDDSGADAAPDAATIADQEVPLAGLTPLYMLLEELRKYEKVEDIELPEDFKWLDHEYAQAIYWGLQEELVVDTEEEPLHPDEVITVALLRSVLTNFVEYKGAELVVTLTGEDDEIVFDLGERLTVFYTELEAALTAKAA